MRSVVIVGAGNIGSHLAPLIARIPEVGRVLVIDRDRYEQTNRQGQAIVAGDVGRAKATVQAAAVRRIAPGIDASAFVGEFEHVPLGRLRVDLILACLDSRRGRQRVNEAAFHLGVPWIDSGVLADDLLARVNVYLPGADRPCLECAWGENDYRAIEQEYPCEADRSTASPAPTNAPAALGALAASLQAIEAVKLLRGRDDLVAAGRQVQIDAARHTHLVTSFRRNPGCRLDEHAAWPLVEIPTAPSGLRLDDLAACLPGRPDPGDCTFSVEGRPFVLALRCSGCGKRRPELRLENVPPKVRKACGSCGGRMTATGFDLRDRLTGRECMAGPVVRSLGAVGVRIGDVVRVDAGDAVARFVIGGDPG